MTSKSNQVLVILSGGLGNQLFQIMCCLSYAIDHHYEFQIINYPVGTHTTTYETTLFQSIATNFTNYIPYDLNVHKEVSRRYQAIPYFEGYNLILSGHFQSEKYFQHNISHIMETLQLDTLRSDVKRRQQRYFTDTKATYVSMHFRFGDFKQLAGINLLDVSYYQQALQAIRHAIASSHLTVYCFCEKESIPDMNEILQQLPPDLTYIHITDTMPDWEQLLLMSLCHHHIVANSTFSWWGAYLNPSPNKVVICRDVKEWYKVSPDEMVDLIPSEWTQI